MRKQFTFLADSSVGVGLHNMDIKKCMHIFVLSCTGVLNSLDNVRTFYLVTNICSALSKNA